MNQEHASCCHELALVLEKIENSHSAECKTHLGIHKMCILGIMRNKIWTKQILKIKAAQQHPYGKKKSIK